MQFNRWRANSKRTMSIFVHAAIDPGSLVHALPCRRENVKLNNMTKEEIDNLMDTKIDETRTVRDALTTQFIGWALKKTDGLPAFDPAVREISMMSTTYMGRSMSPDKKLEVLLKLQKLGVL